MSQLQREGVKKDTRSSVKPLAAIHKLAEPSDFLRSQLRGAGGGGAASSSGSDAPLTASRLLALRRVRRAVVCRGLPVL